MSKNLLISAQLSRADSFMLIIKDSILLPYFNKKLGVACFLQTICNSKFSKLIYKFFSNFVASLKSGIVGVRMSLGTS